MNGPNKLLTIYPYNKLHNMKLKLKTALFNAIGSIYEINIK